MRPRLRPPPPLAQDKQVEKSIEAPALGPEQEPKAKPDSCKHGVRVSADGGAMMWEHKKEGGHGQNLGCGVQSLEVVGAT